MDTATTDNFVKEFTRDKTLFASMKGKFIALGIMPVGVDAEDQRVKSIILECKRRNNGKVS